MVKLASSTSLIMSILSMEMMSMIILFMMIDVEGMINFLTIVITIVMESMLAICIMMKFFSLTHTSGKGSWSTTLLQNKSVFESDTGKCLTFCKALKLINRLSFLV
nr:NADH dehydrogenase subunit 4L [Alcedoecus sp.]